MASLRNCARSVRREAADGIGWIALWKEGRSWNVEVVWADDLSYEGKVMVLWPDDLQRLREIVEADPAAVLVNGYYSNIGVSEDGSLPDVRALTEALRWQYEDCHPLISDWSLNVVS